MPSPDIMRFEIEAAMDSVDVEASDTLEQRNIKRSGAVENLLRRRETSDLEIDKILDDLSSYQAWEKEDAEQETPE